MTMTYCDDCHCHLGTNREITEHLESCHNIHIRMGEGSPVAYCNDCHKYLGRKKKDGRKALETHLTKHHEVHMHEGCME